MRSAPALAAGPARRVGYAMAMERPATDTELSAGSVAPAQPSLLSRRALAIALSPQVVKLALRTSLLIGSLLNLINQGDALLGEAPLVVGKLLLTYLVPYCVATYSATSISLALAR